MPIKKDKRAKRKITLLKPNQRQKPNPKTQTQTQNVVINLADLVKRRPRAKRLVEPIAKKPSEMILTRIIREPAFSPPYQHHVNEPVKVSHAGLEQPQYIPETYKPIVNKDFLEKMGQQPRPFQSDMDILGEDEITEPFSEKMGQQPRPFQSDMDILGEDEITEPFSQSVFSEIFKKPRPPQQQESPLQQEPENPFQQRRPRRRQDDPTLIAEKESKVLKQRLKQEEMERRRENLRIGFGSGLGEKELKALKQRLKQEEMDRRRENERILMKQGGYKSQDE
jgi:hypothetical protein